MQFVRASYQPPPKKNFVHLAEIQLAFEILNNEITGYPKSLRVPHLARTLCLAITSEE